MLIYVTGKALVRVLIAKRTILRRNSGRIEFLIQKQNIVLIQKMILSLILSYYRQHSQKYVFFKESLPSYV